MNTFFNFNSNKLSELNELKFNPTKSNSTAKRQPSNLQAAWMSKDVSIFGQKNTDFSSPTMTTQASQVYNNIKTATLSNKPKEVISLSDINFGSLGMYDDSQLKEFNSMLDEVLDSSDIKMTELNRYRGLSNKIKNELSMRNIDVQDEVNNNQGVEEQTVEDASQSETQTTDIRQIKLNNLRNRLKRNTSPSSQRPTQSINNGKWVSKYNNDTSSVIQESNINDSATNSTEDTQREKIDNLRIKLRSYISQSSMNPLSMSILNDLDKIEESLNNSSTNDISKEYSIDNRLEKIERSLDKLSGNSTDNYTRTSRSVPRKFTIY